MNFYLLFKALHLIAIISWMAGLLYLPRIFVYHSETKNDEVKNTFKIMERRLFVYIMNPAMILSWLFGLILIHSIGLQSFKEFWLIIKVILVRVINEVPTVLLIVIIFLVVFKPI